MTDKTLKQLVIEFIEQVEGDVLENLDLKDECLAGWRILFNEPKFQAMKEKALRDVNDTDVDDIPDKDGWIPHTTGKQPVADDVRVEYINTYNGEEVMERRAGQIYWGVMGSKITHYRIVGEDLPKVTLFQHVEYISNGGLDVLCNTELVSIINDYIEEILIPYLEGKK